MAAGSYGSHPQLLNAQLVPTGGTANHDIAAEPDRSKRPGDRGQCRGPTSAHRSSPRAPHHPKVACNSGARTFSSTPKRCNSNDVISMFEMFTWELHATFLRNHNAKPQRTQAEDNSSPEDSLSSEDAHIPGRRNCQKHRGAAPDMGRCTRTEEVHCLRIGCSAPTYKNKRGTGTPNHSPPHPSMRSWALLVAGRARRPRHHLHPGPLRHLPHPYMRRAGLRAILRVSARNSGFACERHTRPGIVVTTTQTTSPTTPQCQRFSSSWSALWAPHRPEPCSHLHQTGGIAALEPRHAGDTPTGCS